MTDAIYLFTENHGSKLGIEDVVSTLRSFLEPQVEVHTSECLVPGAVNIIIDEFSSYGFVRALGDLKRRDKRTRIVLVATEFITPAPGGGYTFNWFPPSRAWQAMARLAMPILRRRLRRTWAPPKANSGFGPQPRQVNPLLQLVRRLTSFITLQRIMAVTPTIVHRVIRRIAREMPSFYLLERFSGFSAALSEGSIDLVVSLHAAVSNGLRRFGEQERLRLPDILECYPKIDAERFRTQLRSATPEFRFEMSGSITSFRRQIAGAVEQQCRWHLPSTAPIKIRSFYELRAKPAGADEHHSERPALFALHPPQSSMWPASSPMRLYRSFRRGEMPAVPIVFGDHPLENACAKLDGPENLVRLHDAWFYNREAFVEETCERLAAYNSVASEANRRVVDAVCSLLPMRVVAESPAANRLTEAPKDLEIRN